MHSIDIFLLIFGRKCDKIDLDSRQWRRRCVLASSEHPPDRCGITRWWLGGIIATQVCLGMVMIKWSLWLHNTMPQMFQALRGHKLSAGGSSSSAGSWPDSSLSDLSKQLLSVTGLRHFGFYWWQFECTKILSWDSETLCHAIHCHHDLMLQHDNARPYVVRICAQFQEAEIIPLLHCLCPHQTCHALSMFGLLWIGVYNSVFWFLPISRN